MSKNQTPTAPRRKYNETFKTEALRLVTTGNFFSISLYFDLTLHGRGRVQLTEIGVYEVQTGKIVREQFFY